MAHMAEADFMTLLGRLVSSAHLVPEKQGFTLERTKDRWLVQKPRSIYANDFASFSITNLTAGDARLVSQSMRNWWNEQRIIEAAIAAHDLLHGAVDDIMRPYAIDTVTLRHFLAKGIDVRTFLDAMREVTGPFEPEEISTHMDVAHSSFHLSNVPKPFSRYWSNGTKPIPQALSVIGDIQFRLADRIPGTMTAIHEIAPGALWRGGTRSQLVLEDQDMPETLIAAIIGRPVTDMVDHPALQVDGLTVTSIRKEKPMGQDEKRLVIGLKRITTDVTAFGRTGS